MITIDQLNKFCQPKDPQGLLMALIATMNKREINTPRRIRYFMAQAYHESQGFLQFEEDLYYADPNRLVAVWPTHFSMQQDAASKGYAPDYVRNSQKLGSFIYASKYGNGDEQSGDGYAFRGQGAFGLTFHDNYQACSQDTYGDDRLIQNPALVAQMPGAIDSAGWFWAKHNLNVLADSDSLTDMTRVINGSIVTVPQRLQVLNKANAIF
jgi:putative chitinase